MKQRTHQNEFRQAFGSLYDAVTDMWWMMMMLIADQHNHYIDAVDVDDDQLYFDDDHHGHHDGEWGSQARALIEANQRQAATHHVDLVASVDSCVVREQDADDGRVRDVTHVAEGTAGLGDI